MVLCGRTAGSFSTVRLFVEGVLILGHIQQRGCQNYGQPLCCDALHSKADNLLEFFACGEGFRPSCFCVDSKVCDG